MLAALAVALPAMVSGCSLSDVLVVVAGRDANGTLVVGSTDCSFGGERADEMRLVHLTEGFGRTVLWSVGNGPTDPVGISSGPAQGPPRAPVPTRLDEVRLVAVGDPDPVGWQVQTELTEPIPEDGQLLVEVDQETIETTITTRLDVPPDRAPDRFVAEVDGTSYDHISAADLAAKIAQRCHEADGLDGGRFLVVVGGSGAVVAALGLVAGILTVRQYRRAGRAVADRRAATGLPGQGWVP